ncbi:ATP-dependent nuclease [Elstera cyanobacteriorum]|uniref:ATPase AAA-type core domain-containing protein n=1 Tax=Elstera cyanobacteriorum TaxID=2022747 RepID=A0A255XLA3_9PROT|nr:AAA family ATPase [Elstera cyanobacteriorum]OYQ17728.1 hypothetical protein CHR90_12130 [Elstera cyanobacteriorum]
MIIRSAVIQNYKSLGSLDLKFSNINVLIGKNNTGKSALLEALSVIQVERNKPIQVSIGKHQFYIEYYIDNYLFLPEEWKRQIELSPIVQRELVHISVSGDRQGNINIAAKGRASSSLGLERLENRRDTGLFVKFLSERKIKSFVEVVNNHNYNKILDDLSLLSSLVAHVVMHPNHPSMKFYNEKSQSVLGFTVGNIMTEHGQHPGIKLINGEQISVNEMGSGVCNIVAFIAELSIAKNKIFLIEELENDIHPGALKLLLEAIVEKSDENQFFISTHSHIVLTHLACHKFTNILSFDNVSDGQYPISKVQNITDSSEKRKYALEDLGYHFSDFGLFRGWIIFEESSMEEIVRDYLIEWFFPSLYGKIRTVSAGGADNTKRHFGEIHRMYLYTHLQPVYKNCAWVVLDGDKKGKEVKNKLLEKFKECSDDTFICLQKESLEMYYPEEIGFDKMILEEKSGNDKDSYKKECLQKFKKLASEKNDYFKSSCKESFSEIILILEKIQQKIPLK